MLSSILFYKRASSVEIIVFLYIYFSNFKGISTDIDVKESNGNANEQRVAVFNKQGIICNSVSDIYFSLD